MQRSEFHARCESLRLSIAARDMYFMCLSGLLLLFAGYLFAEASLHNESFYQLSTNTLKMVCSVPSTYSTEQDMGDMDDLLTPSFPDRVGRELHSRWDSFGLSLASGVTSFVSSAWATLPSLQSASSSGGYFSESVPWATVWSWVGGSWINSALSALSGLPLQCFLRILGPSILPLGLCWLVQTALSLIGVQWLLAVGGLGIVMKVLRGISALILLYALYTALSPALVSALQALMPWVYGHLCLYAMTCWAMNLIRPGRLYWPAPFGVPLNIRPLVLYVAYPLLCLVLGMLVACLEEPIVHRHVDLASTTYVSGRTIRLQMLHRVFRHAVGSIAASVPW
jgi:hypothetical protein